MVHPAIALLLAGAVIVVVCILLWPKRGLLPLAQRALQSGERTRTEDALKHLYDCEYRGSWGSIQSLAGSLERGAFHITRLVARLEAMGLVRTGEAGLCLTAAGRSYALRIIRIHRLWETYLADRTGFQEGEWHFEADRREHATSAGQLQQLVRTTGNPRYDPHGDPIPTEQGEVPARDGQSLSDCAPGDDVRVVHVEDEPEAIYAQLRAQNIRFNQRVTVLDKSPERIRIEVDGGEQAVAPIVAGNVWVTVLPQGTRAEISERLSSLRVGESRAVVGISPACQGLQRRRLLDLGLIRGTEVAAVMENPTRDATGYRIRGAVIALRREQADLIQVRRRSNGGDRR